MLQLARIFMLNMSLSGFGMVFALVVCSVARDMAAEQSAVKSAAADASDNVEEILEIAFAADSSNLDKDLAEVQKVLSQGSVSFQEGLQDIVALGSKIGSVIQNGLAVKHLATMITEGQGLKNVLNDAVNSGGKALDAALLKIRKYSHAVAKNKKMRKVGKFAELQKLSKAKRIAVKDAKEALEGLAEQSDLLAQQFQSQSRMAGFYALAQLADSSYRCYEAVSAYREHAKQLGEWKDKIEEWTDKLVENRKIMRMFMNGYRKTKTWDLSLLSTLTWRANAVFNEVKAFHSDLAAARKSARSNLMGGLTGAVCNLFNGGLGAFQALANPIAGLSGFAMAAGVHAVGTAADVATAVYAHLDVQQLEGVLSYGEAVLREASHQVEVLKKASHLIERQMLAQWEAKADLQDDVDEDTSLHAEL